MTGIEALAHQAVTRLEELGPLAPLGYVPFYVAGTLLFFPHPLLIVTAGALFGVPAGFALVSLSSMISAGGVFLAGRYLSRGWLQKKISSNEKVKAIDEAVGREGWKMVALLRSTAVLPFSVMNYALGLSKISFRHYFLASWIGMMPGQLLYVYLGSSFARALALKKDRPPHPLEWVFFGLSIVATVWISVYATKVIKKAASVPAGGV